MKIIKLLCAFLLSITLIACSDKTTAISIEETNTIEDYIKYDVLYSEVSDTIEPPIISSTYQYLYPKSNDNTLIDIVFKITNISQETIKATDLKGQFTINDEKINTITVFNETDTKLCLDGDILANKTYIIHMYGEVSKETDFNQDITFELTANKQKSVLTYQLNELSLKQTLTKKDKISSDDIVITIKDIITENTIHPTYKATAYFYYKADEGIIFKAIKVNIKNAGNKEISTSSLVGIKAKIDNTKYNGYIIAEDEKQQNILTSTTIAANESRTAYFVVEIPEEDKNKDIDFTIYFNNQFYNIKK